MEITIRLNTPEAGDEIVVLNDYIREKNLRGIITKVGEQPAEEGAMSMGDWMPVLQMILGSTVVAAGVKGLFDILKEYFELRKQRIIADEKMAKRQTDVHKIEFTLDTKEGKQVKLKFSSFDEKERKQFLKSIDSVLKA